MGSDLIQALIMVAGGGVVASAVFLFARFHKQARIRSWQRAVAHSGLTEAATQDKLFGSAVTARDGDLEVRLEAYHRGKHQHGTRLTIRPLSRRFGALTIRAEGLGTAFEKRLMGAREIELGDHVFDRDCFVQGPKALAMATLTSEVRRNLARLLRGPVLTAHGRELSPRVSLEDGVLQVELRDNLFSAADDLPDVLDLALGVARGLRPPDDLGARLAENLRDEKDPDVRIRLVETLAREFPSHPKTAAALLAACSDESDEVRLRAAVVTPVEGRRTLIALASSDTTDDGLRARAVAALGGQVPVELAEATLRRALEAPAPETARACLDVLQALRRHESEPLLQRALEATDDSVRQAAARALRTCGSVASVARLLEIARDGKTSELRQAARLAVGDIQSRLPGAAPGQLALAEGTAGGLSLVDATPVGELSLADGEPSLSRAEVPVAGALLAPASTPPPEAPEPPAGEPAALAAEEPATEDDGHGAPDRRMERQ